LLVSHRKNFIFVKTQKTAGTSVESVFEKYCMKDGLWLQTHDRDQVISEYGMIGGRGQGAKYDKLYSHLTAEQIKELVSEEIWHSYFKFSVIRNPFDRLISRYFFSKKKENPKYFEDMDEQGVIKEFRSFIKQRKYPIADHLKINGQLALDFLIRYETLNSDIEHVANHLGVEFKSTDLPTFKSEYRISSFTPDMLYDELSIAYVNDTYAEEIETFGYSFEGLMAQ